MNIDISREEINTTNLQTCLIVRPCRVLLKRETIDDSILVLILFREPISLFLFLDLICY